MPVVLSDSATCSFVFLPDVPFGVVPIAIVLTTNPAKLIMMAAMLIAQTTSALKSLVEVLQITGIAAINNTTGS